MKFRDDRETVSQYLFDESNAFNAVIDSVDGVFFPETEAELAEIVKNASGRITTSGAGTGITGSRVPMSGGIVISTERMLEPLGHDGCRKIGSKGLAGEITIFLDEEKGLAHVAPGLSLSELAGVLPRNLMYPPDPTETSASLGGTVATNASGARCFHYGPTRNWVAGLRIVLSDGEVLDIRRGECFADGNGDFKFSSIDGKAYSATIPDYRMPDIKNAAGLFSKPGMDLIDLFIGSEGLLGIISEVTIRLERTDGEPISDLAFFDSEEGAMAYVDTLRGLKGSGILAIEYFDRTALDFVRGEHPELRGNLGAAVYVEMRADSLDLMDRLSKMLAEFGAVEDWCAHTYANRRDLKEFRHSLPDGVNAYLKRHKSYKLGTDFVVPKDRFPEMMEKYREVGERFRGLFPREGAHYVIFGHIGDCHVHFNFITGSEEERTEAKALHTELALHSISLGGTISGEHGVGKKALPIDGRNVPYLELMYGEAGLREIARVKKALDPLARLNLGNMVPAESF